MIEVHERFRVPAGPDVVWRIVSDPDAVVSCIAGATLQERHEDGSYSGSMGVSFGPMKVSFNARVTFDCDHEARVGRIAGRGKDSAGGTRSKMAFTFTVAEDNGGSLVAGDGEVEIQGPLAGMIEAGASVVIKRMLVDFSARLTARATAAAAPGVPASGSGPAVAEPQTWWRKLVAKLRSLFSR